MKERDTSSLCSGFSGIVAPVSQTLPPHNLCRHVFSLCMRACNVTELQLFILQLNCNGAKAVKLNCKINSCNSEILHTRRNHELNESKITTANKCFISNRNFQLIRFMISTPLFLTEFKQKQNLRDTKAMPAVTVSQSGAD